MPTNDWAFISGLGYSCGVMGLMMLMLLIGGKVGMNPNGERTLKHPGHGTSGGGRAGAAARSAVSILGGVGLCSLSF